MAIQLADIAKKIDATLVGGRGDKLIEGAAALAEATDSEISFLSNPKYAAEACRTQAAAVIVGKDIPEIKTAKLVTANPYLGWARALEFFVPDRAPHLPEGINDSAVVHDSAVIGRHVHIGAHVVIGSNTVIGDHCIIHSGAVIEENCRLLQNVEIHPNVVVHYGSMIGNNCVIWSNAVIGGYGFGNARDGSRYVGIPQLGAVVLEDDVSIGAGTTVDRGAIGNTVIRRGAKIDNLVMIAHNVEIGEDTAIASQTGISGSTKIGDRVVIAGQAGFVGHVSIGDDSFIGAKAGIAKSFPTGSKISGYPARNLMDVRRSDAAVANLPELSKKVRELEKLIEQLKQTQDNGS